MLTFRHINGHHQGVRDCLVTGIVLHEAENDY